MEVFDFEQWLLDQVMSGSFDYNETDNDGQIVIYTGRYRWADGSIHTEPEE